MNYRQPFEGSYGISQGYGEKDTNPKGHTGIDFLCPLGTPVLAAESGTVLYAGWKDGGYGYCVYIQHPDGNTTIYEHLLSTIPVKVFQHVEKSQIIGYSGTTGNSTGPHLHFEVRGPDGKTIDPMTLLHSSVEPAVSGGASKPSAQTPPPLKEPGDLGQNVEVICTAGAKAWDPDFTKYEVFPQGTDLTFTGKTCEHFGYTYCQCYPAPRLFWVAVNDHTDQILGNA